MIYTFLTLTKTQIPFQSSETHISLGVEDIVGSKRTITGSESEAGEVTITDRKQQCTSKKNTGFEIFSI